MSLPYNWVILEPLNDNKKREVLFILARSAGYVLYQHMMDSSYWEQDLRNELYLGCNGLFVAPFRSITIRQVATDKRVILTYEQVFEGFKQIIEKNNI